MWETVLYRVQAPIAWITLNRPQVLNAINHQLEAELVEALRAAEADPVVRVIILMGAGRAFSAGYDLKETARNPIKGAAAWRRRLQDHLVLINQVWDSPKPVIAAVHGFAVGGGCDLTMTCDLTIAAESAYFGEPEIKFGSGVVTLMMPWLVGMKKTRELLYTGRDRITAQQAEALGLVNSVVPDASLEQAATDLALEIATVDADSIRLTKSAINRTYEIMGLPQALQYNIEIDTQIEIGESAERQEFDRLRAEQGLKAALVWRDGRFRRDGRQPQS